MIRVLGFDRCHNPDCDDETLEPGDLVCWAGGWLWHEWCL